MTEPIRILYMEDNPGLARLFEKRLERAGYTVDVARDGEEGLAMYAAGSYDMVAVDQQMPAHSGLDVIRILASQGPLPPMIMVTGTSNERVAVEAMKLGVGDYVVKDVDGGYLELLPTVIEQVLQQRRLVEERQQALNALRESEEKYRELVEGSLQGVVVRQGDKYVLANQAFADMVGYSTQELLEFTLDEVYAMVHADDQEMIAQRYRDRQAGKVVPDSYEHRFIRKDGGVGWAQATVSEIEIQGEQAFLGVYLDVTERKRAEAERERLLVAEREQRLLAETLAGVTLAITSLISHEAVLDEILRQVHRVAPYSTANIALWEGDALRVARWRGYEAFGGEELISSLVQTLDDLTVDLDAIQSRQPLVIPDTSQELRWVLFDETAWIRSYLVVPICLHDQVLGLLRLDSDTPGRFSVEDAERLQPLANAAAIALQNARLFGEVQRLATTDGLTGIYNRRHFFELAESELNRARRFGHPVSAIMLDIDHFKQVNDTYGHAVGDQVLRVVAKRCGESIRDIDVLGRYGGEEFAVILPSTDLPGARTMAERLRRSVADAPVPTDKGDLTVTISLGVASNAQDDGDVAALLNRADAAMYAAKQAGRNRVAVI